MCARNVCSTQRPHLDQNACCGLVQIARSNCTNGGVLMLALVPPNDVDSQSGGGRCRRKRCERFFNVLLFYSASTRKVEHAVEHPAVGRKLSSARSVGGCHMRPGEASQNKCSANEFRAQYHHIVRPVGRSVGADLGMHQRHCRSRSIYRHCLMYCDEFDI